MTDAFYNRGLWGPVVDPPAIFAALRGLVRGGRCFWRGTTAAHDPKREKVRDEAGVRGDARNNGCEIFDAQLMTDAFRRLPWTHPSAGELARRERANVFVDGVHFMPWVYEEINNLLLNVLCNGDASWERHE